MSARRPSKRLDDVADYYATCAQESQAAEEDEAREWAALSALFRAEAASCRDYERWLDSEGGGWDGGIDEPHHWTLSLAEHFAVADALDIP